MKRFILCLMAVTMVSVTVEAQEYAPIRWQGVYTNRFWDNWEVAAAGGNSLLQITQKGSDYGKFMDRNGWNANIAVSKWVVPTLGMRLQLDAGEFHNFTRPILRTGGMEVKMPYLFVHGDILINMSNWIGGYDPDRFYSAVSYMGFGYTAMSWTKKSQSPYNGEYAFTTGLINKFRISPRFDIELDLRSWLIAERSLPKEIQRGGRFAVAMSASLGVAYRFNQRYWSPAYSQVDVDGYLLAIMALEEQLIGREAELKRTNNNVAVLKNENESLRHSLAESRTESNVVVATIPTESVVFFTIGEATLTDYAKATLDSTVAQLTASDADIIITGYADKETGSAKRNEQLSMQRAENVANYLIGLGVPASRITTNWVGDTEQAFASPDTPTVNRCVIIKL
ncbi:MAG: OmpA family protein [Alistipes sp.]|nr:OmpA family protein [Alistipes sp.]MBO7264593.1 OmpA family protein [Alistipes sp.]